MLYQYFFCNAYLVAGLTEETLKFIMTWRVSNSFKSPASALVIGIIAALGFAVVENIKYVVVAGLSAHHIVINPNVHSYFIDLLRSKPFLYGIVVAAERGIISVPAHCLFGALIGLGFAEVCTW